ncbi:MAG TPA: hypothetical protein VFE17_13415 [Candidatus Baltobacteraceae bacterium]|jgi:hypothetical protein|nr:hypothetical protein [Candidatus Baltobacteraceae bacterium]
MRGTFTVFALLSAASLLVPRPAQAVLPGAVVTSKQPAPQARLRTFYPLISASIRHAGGSNVHVFLDGKDVTSFAGRQGDRIEYVPRDRLPAGWHDVFLEGTGADGWRFSDAWVFQTQAPDLDWDDSNTGSPVFIPVGTTLASSWYGGFLHFFFVGPGDGFAVLQLCNLGAYPFQHFPGSPVFLVTVPYTPFTSLSNCQVTAFFTPLAGGQTQYFPLGIAGPPMSARSTVTPGVRTYIPLYRSPPTGSAGATTMRSLPAAGARPQMMVVPGTRIPHVSVPHATIPHP